MICWIIVNVRWERLAIIKSYLSIIPSRQTNSRTISADMDGFQDGGYIWAQGVLQYHPIEVPWSLPLYLWYLSPTVKTPRAWYPGQLGIFLRYLPMRTGSRNLIFFNKQNSILSLNVWHFWFAYYSFEYHFKKMIYIYIYIHGYKLAP